MFWQKNKQKEKRRRKKRRKKPKSGINETLENFVVEEIEIGAVPTVGPDETHHRKFHSRSKSKWFEGIRFTAGWMGLWLLIVVAGLLSRNAWPADETRYLALAWDLLQRDAWLLPHLNGEPYLSQPPLGLWLIRASWNLAGFSDAWPVLLSGLAGLFSLFVTRSFSRQLWPDQREVIRYVPLFLLGTGLWAMFQTLTLSDLLVVGFTSLSLLITHKVVTGSVLAGLFLGPVMALAMLSGGPVTLVYMLPVMLLAPMWASRNKSQSWSGWYGVFALGVAIAIGVWVMWIVAAGEQASLEWQQAVIAGSSMQSLSMFYEQGSWWWYLYLIPLVFFPWSVWPLGWMRLWHVRSEKLDGGIVMCMIWGIPAIVLLSLLPVRQPQLLLPLFPAYAMVLVRLLMHEDLRTQGEDSFFAGVTLPVIAIGALLAILPGLPRVPFLPQFLWEISPFIGVAIAALGIAFSWAQAMNIGKRIGTIAVTTMFVVVAGNFIAGYQFDERYHSDELFNLLYLAEQEEKAIAQVGPYQGEFHYHARLRNPVSVLSKDDLLKWVANNPEGLILTYSDRWQPARFSAMTPLLEVPYGSITLRVWDGLTVAAQG